MQRVLDLVEGERQRLCSEPLFEFLADESQDGWDRLSFAPAMLYYLMGFKDVLSELERPQPESKLDHFINAYCGEDGDHWRWYLTDMQRLGFGLDSLGEHLVDFCNEVWGDSTRINRLTIFRLIEYARRSSDPLIALTLINVFEATGVVFIGYTRKATIALGLDDELHYFGRTHFEEEFGHSVQSKDLAQFELSDESFALAAEFVPKLFADYRQLFDCWHSHVGKFERTRHLV